MREERDLICVVCPVGCQIRASVEEGRLVEALGPACKRGVAFAEEEIRAPKRMLTTTVQVIGGEWPLVPVRSSTPMPKDKLLAAATFLRAVRVSAPVALYQVIASDVLGTGVDMVASRVIALADAAEPA